MSKFKVIHGASGKELHRAKYDKSLKAKLARTRSTLRQVEIMRDYLRSGKATSEVERIEAILDNAEATLKEFIRVLEPSGAQ